MGKPAQEQKHASLEGTMANIARAVNRKINPKPSKPKAAD